MHQRNTQGLKDYAQHKRSQAMEQTEKAIRELIEQGRSINFETVAHMAGVSRAWLYNQPEFRARIEQLRSQQPGNKKVPQSQSASKASNTAMVRTLKQQIHKTRAENQGLRQHIEEILGRNFYADEQAEKFRKEAEALRAEKEHLLGQIETLKSALEDCLNHTSIDDSPVASISCTPSSSMSDLIKMKLKALGIKLNSTLRHRIEKAPSDRVLAAIEEMNRQWGEIKNPSGWLVRAIDEGWTKADPIQQQDRQPEVFKASTEPEQELVPIDQLKKLLGGTDE